MFKVIMGEKTFVLDQKTPIKNLISEEDKYKYFAAKVNNRLRELTYELCFDCTVELLDASKNDAIKVYETSLRFLLAMAFNNLYPDYQIRISYNISRSLLVSILTPDDVIADKKLVNSIKEELDRLVALDLPFEKATLSKEEAKLHYKKQNQVDKEAILKYRPEKNCHFNICDNYMNYMDRNEE